MAEVDKTPKNDGQDDGNIAGTGSDGAVFTQEQLDAIIKDRLDRATNSTTAKLLADLGIEDVDTAKKTLQEAAELKQSQLSEVEKLQAEVVAAQEVATKAQAERDAIQATARESALRAEVVSVAATLNFHNPQKTYLLIDKSNVEITEQGEFKGVKEALDALAEEEPYLVKGEVKSTVGTPVKPIKPSIAEQWKQKQEMDQETDYKPIKF